MSIKLATLTKALDLERRPIILGTRGVPGSFVDLQLEVFTVKCCKDVSLRLSPLTI